jgi:tetraacyldisaccharide 4'-kinase
VLLLDDGFQNPALAKDLSLLVVDGGYGFGNGLVLPAGPLREPAAAGLDRADAVVLMGEDTVGILPRLAGRPLLRARLAPVDAGPFRGRRVVAFAGIGRPGKFFATLEEAGAVIAARRAFADHHAYAVDDLQALAAIAATQDAALATTAKDAARLPPAWRDRVSVLDIQVAWADEPALAALLARVAGEAAADG